MIDYQRMQLRFLEDRLRSELLAIFDFHTVEEWIGINVSPTITKLNAAAEARDRLLSQKTWPRRPLDRIVTDQEALKGVCTGSGSLSCALLGQ